MDLNVNVEGEGATKLVRLEGTCDLATAPELRKALQSLVPPDVTEIVVDVTELSFIDSTGLGVILGAMRRQREGGGDLRISGASGAVRRVLEVTDLDKVIPLDAAPPGRG